MKKPLYRKRAEESDSDDDSDNIKCVHNNIYFYCNVSRKSVLKLVELLEEVQQKILKWDMKENDINVYIQSDGGDLFAGISAMNYIENMEVCVNTLIDGFAASAATIIALGGHRVYMHKYATLLIHQISTGFIGKFEDFMDEAKNSKYTMDTVKSIYNDKTDIPDSKMVEYLKKDIYISADTCLKYKIVDVIY